MTVAEEVGRLRKELSRLSQENERLKEMASGGESSSLVEINLRLMKRVAELEEQQNKLEAEKKTLQDKAEQAEQEKDAIKQTLEDKDAAVAKMITQVEKFGKTVVALESKLDYAENKKPLVDGIIRLEKRPELEDFYKKQPPEYLQKELKRLQYYY